MMFVDFLSAVALSVSLCSKRCISLNAPAVWISGYSKGDRAGGCLRDSVHPDASTGATIQATPLIFHSVHVLDGCRAAILRQGHSVPDLLASRMTRD